MLPFLKPKHVAGVIVSQRKPDGSNEISHSEGNELADLEVACEDIIRAMGAKDAKRMAEAFKAAFEICESYPHDEVEHEPSEEQE